MRFFVEKFKWVMLVAGLLTCTMFLGLVSPQMSLESNFGETLPEPISNVLVRTWSALIGMNGIMLLYGAFRQAVRKFVLVIVSLSKLTFICIGLIYGQQYLDNGLGTAIVADAVMVALFAAYLVLAGRSDVG